MVSSTGGGFGGFGGNPVVALIGIVILVAVGYLVYKTML
jgi:hypothetical protein